MTFKKIILANEDSSLEIELCVCVCVYVFKGAHSFKTFAILKKIDLVCYKKMVNQK